MTTKTKSILRGWGIGLSAAIVATTVVLFSSGKESDRDEIRDIYVVPILEDDTIQYPSLFDAHMITNIPLDSLRDAIISNQEIDGRKFSKLE